MLTFIISYLGVFIISDYKNLYLLSILHLYHHLFAELVHLDNLPLYWVCWGHKRLFVIWLQGCLRETIFILRLPQIDKPYVIHLREILYCPTKLCAWRPNTSLQEEGCVVDISRPSGQSTMAPTPLSRTTDLLPRLSALPLPPWQRRQKRA